MGMDGHLPVMRFQIFFSGVAVLALGMAAMQMLAKDAAIGFLQGALTLGGGFIICGLFSLKMKWHGIIGGGVLALLGAARGLGNLPDLAGFLTGERERGATPVELCLCRAALNRSAHCIAIILDHKHDWQVP